MENVPEIAPDEDVIRGLPATIVVSDENPVVGVMYIVTGTPSKKP